MTLPSSDSLLTSTSSRVQSTSGIQRNQNFSTGTDDQHTRSRTSKSGMISPHQEIPVIQSKHTRSACNRNTGTMDDPINLGLSAYSGIPYVEIISIDEDEINEVSEEARTEMASHSSSNFLETLKPDPALKCEYQKYFVNNDLVGFLERYIPDTMNKFDVRKMIVALGYPKESIKNYEHLTVSDTLEVLMDLMRTDVLHDGSSQEGRRKSGLGSKRLPNWEIITPGIVADVNHYTPMWQTQHSKLVAEQSREVLQYFNSNYYSSAENEEHEWLEQRKKRLRNIKERCNSGIRLCARCGKKRPNNEPLKTRMLKSCTKCRLSDRRRNTDIRRCIEESRNSGIRLCTKCGKERPDDEPGEDRKLKQCTQCRLYGQQLQQTNKRNILDRLNSGVRLCTNCGKERPDDEAEEARKYKMCSNCRSQRREKYYQIRRFLNESYKNGIRFCTKCEKQRPDDEAEEDRKFKSCTQCRLYGQQLQQTNKRNILDRLNNGVRLCTSCGKERPDDEAEEARKFKRCSNCRSQSRERYHQIRRFLNESYKNGIRLCNKCGKQRPDDEAEEDRKFKYCSSCRLDLRNSTRARRKNRNRAILPSPTPVQMVSANTRARTRSRTDRASNSSQVQSTSGIQHNQNFALGTDKRQTRSHTLKSGMISPHQEIAEIQLKHARLACNGNTGTMDDPNNLGLSAYSDIPYVEIISSDEDEINEVSEEARTEMASHSSSNFLETLKPDPALKCEYQKYFVNNNLVGFLERYIPDTMNKFDVCKIIVALGYPKESIKNYEHLTVSDTLEVLIDLMRTDVLHDGVKPRR
ncbi:uncharacterized protein J8A68_001807 [[Candida] subhashii]|uniref:Uncharacterized protein n=1 Tax=[Candida] subhashii TaxID=561895 RepID=A0A8J5R199_9ASCO|nr:uncharacterized protein J8A68_001807 [[Candida] subhashii]KAG7664645.1 hypothetical protein J8A68_001807 [[Candida] subhashii]